jgi:hypothetical protein
MSIASSNSHNLVTVTNQESASTSLTANNRKQFVTDANLYSGIELG